MGEDDRLLREHAKLLDIAQEAIIHRDVSGKILFWSRGAERIYGWTAAEALSKTTHALLQTKFPKQPQEFLEEFLRDGVWSGELLHHRKDGSTITVQSHWVLHEDEAGQRILETNIDITDRKQAEDALRRHEAKLRHVTDAIPAAIVYLDKDLNYQMVNKTYEGWYGISARNVIGKSITAVANPERLAKVMPYLRKALNGENTSYENWFDFPSGRKYIRISYAPEKDEHGVNGITILAEDLSEHKRAEDALRTSEERFRTMFSLAAVGMAQGSIPEGRFIAVNEQFATLMGYDQQEMIGKTYLDITHPDDRATSNQEITDLIAGKKQIASYEKRYVRKDGTPIWVHVSVSIARDTAGKPIHTIGVVEDITRRKQAQRLIEQQRAQLEAVFHSMQDGIVVFDMDGNALLVNEAEARINGYGSSTEMMRDLSYFAQVYELSLPDGTPLPVSEWPVSKVLRGEKITDWELKGRRRDTGREWVFSFSGEPVYDDGKQILAVTITRDITAQKAVQEALAESEERFRSTFEQAAVGLAHVSLDGKWLRVNSKLCEILGYTPEELSTLTFQDITHPDDLQLDLEHAKELLEGRIKTYSMEKRYIRKDGEVIWANLTGSTMRAADGSPRYFIAVVEDITERKATEAQRKESEERFRSMFNLAAVGMAQADLNGNLIAANLRLAEMAGLSVDELLEKQFADITHPDDRTKDATAFQELVSGRIASFSHEKRYIHTSGATIWANTSVTLIRDHEGKPKHAVAVIVDITQRKEAEELLRRSEELYRSTFEQAAIGVNHLSLDGKWLRVNSKLCEILGYTREELMGLTRDGITHPDDREQDHLAEQELLEGKRKNFYLEKRFIRKDGTPVWVSRSGVLVSTADGRPDYFISVIEDITKSREALALRDDFLSIASHELKTPVTSIKAFLQAIEMRMDKPQAFDFEKNRQYMQLSIKQVDRLAALINDLLDITRISKGRIEYRFTIHPMGPVIAEVVERLSASFPSHRLLLHLEDLTTSARIDMMRFEQALTNIITNAVKYSPEGSTITITMRVHEGNIHISVADRGIGISKEQQEHIFNLYYRTAEAVDARASGLGVGLYISVEFIKAHGGNIQVESSQGKGSIFTITLPVAKEHEKEHEKAGQG